MMFFFNDTATTEIYTLSLHDALPICHREGAPEEIAAAEAGCDDLAEGRVGAVVRAGVLRFLESLRAGEGAAVHDVLRILDRKSTRLNSSHANISYAVFCLQKKPAYAN